MPKAVAPDELPAPLLDGVALEATMRSDDALAAKASREPLDLDIRAVGREMRDYNLAAARGDDEGLFVRRTDLVAAVGKALTRSEEQLLELRAYQMAAFLVELGRWRETGIESQELSALAGDFVSTLKRNRWCRDHQRTLVMDEGVLRVLFKKRWNDVAGLAGPRFDPTLDEDRVRFGFLLRHPFRRQAPRGARPSPRTTALRDGQARLQTVERLKQRDPSYPAELARGVVMYQTGRFALAAEAFRSHLELRPDGPHTLRARNYLKAALDMASLTSP
jgi:hypothetical protein